MTEKNKTEKGTLYLVPTPIGNLADITERALKVLSEVDFIAAEDTRKSRVLLTHFGISKPLVSYYEHNKREHGKLIVDRLRGGESCALVTDAGTPAISDPGEDLVRLCADEGVPVIPLPGACAAISALAVSALPSGRFCFEGFLTTCKSERKERLEELSGEKRTLIFYEAPHKLKNTLRDLADAFGEDRRISICRELTKINEEIVRTTLGEAVAYYDDKEPRGEYVLVVEGSSLRNDAPAYWASMSIREHVEYHIKSGMSKMDAIKTVAKERGVTKNTIYKEMI